MANLEEYIDNARRRKERKKQSRKVAFSDYRKYRDGVYDQDTGLPKLPTRLRKSAKKQTEDKE